MNTKEKEVGLPEAGKPTLFNRIKETLAVASQLIIAAPVKLPPKVLMVAKYVALALGVLEAAENASKRKEDIDDEE